MANNLTQLLPYGVGQQGSPTQQGGGGSTRTDLVGYRSILDARRSMALPAQTPEAQYPDGYLGNVNSRRQDRIMDALQKNLTNKSYQRGVHKGEKLSPQDYMWDRNVDPEAGLRAEAAGRRWTVSGAPEERLAHMGKNAVLTPMEMGEMARRYGVYDPGEMTVARQAYLQRMLPSWK